MASHPRDMNLRAATLAGLLLAAAGTLLLWTADEGTDVAAVAGGIAVVVAGSLLGLTFLARRWDRARSGYVQTHVDVSPATRGTAAARARQVHADDAAAR